ncbi:serine/threonine-protein kinase Env7p [Diutina catenulata]
MNLWTCFLVCFPCFPDLSSPALTINGQRYQIVRLLGEGGFSYVYLVTQASNLNQQFALKKIRCVYGSNDDSYVHAMKEIRNYHRFSKPTTSPYVIQSISEAVVDESDGSKTVFILLPYFEKSLQDIINELVLNDDVMPEDDILRIFVGVCRGVKHMHTYKKISRGTGDAVPVTDGEADALLPFESDDDEVTSQPSLGGGTELSELCPYAHRDLKPANVMLGPEGIPVLVDLGSCSRARITVTTRQQALTLTDYAQEHCTLPYRAPELLDVATNTTITEATDIWSLGCVLYCCCFGYSPFEKLELEQGANLNIAIAQAKYTIPANTEYSSALLDMIKSCLQLDPHKRPKIDELLESALAASRQG